MSTICISELRGSSTSAAGSTEFHHRAPGGTCGYVAGEGSWDNFRLAWREHHDRGRTERLVSSGVDGPYWTRWYFRPWWWCRYPWWRSQRVCYTPRRHSENCSEWFCAPALCRNRGHAILRRQGRGSEDSMHTGGCLWRHTDNPCLQGCHHHWSWHWSEDVGATRSWECPRYALWFRGGLRGSCPPWWGCSDPEAIWHWSDSTAPEAKDTVDVLVQLVDAYHSMFFQVS